MRAIAIGQYGGRDTLQLVDLPTPEPAAGEIRVRVHAAGVNPVDWKIREGRVQARIPGAFPLIPGWDAAGTVDACGPGATNFHPGDAVFAYCRKPVIQHGTYAEYVCIPQVFAATKPSTLSFEEAAALPLAGLTAYQSLVEAAGLRVGDKVLVHAAAGGVGGFAVQIAKILGAYVVATAGPDNQEAVRALGADDAIDYTSADFVEAVHRRHPQGIDIVFDTVGGEVQTRSAQVLRKAGVLVSILALQDEAGLRAKGVEPRYVFVAPNAAQLGVLARWADAGVLRASLAEVLPLEQAARAHELSESGHVRGKIVLRIA
ncbi:MAG: NADP-dependent oxidoreductase [Proteobacteria bacterium]|nr:NADP-dependent oxidoreductase [Pseudomonadota bacterium]